MLTKITYGTEGIPVIDFIVNHETKIVIKTIIHEGREFPAKIFIGPSRRTYSGIAENLSEYLGYMNPKELPEILSIIKEKGFRADAQINLKITIEELEK